MIIRINQTPVDFTLETERTLAELVVALEGWATSQGLALLSVLADGRSFDTNDTRELASLQEVDVEAVSRSAHDAARVTVVGDYFRLLSSAASEHRPEGLAAIGAEYPAVRAALVALTDGLEERVSASLGVLDAPWNDSGAVATAALALVQVADTRAYELSDPEGALRQTFIGLDERLESLAALSQLFQRGQDHEAFALILELFTLLEDANRRAALVLEEVNSVAAAWVTFQEELQPFLRETQDALSAGDYILLTDLLEYEVIPRVVAAKSLFPGLSKLDPVGDLP